MDDRFPIAGRQCPGLALAEGAAVPRPDSGVGQGPACGPEARQNLNPPGRAPGQAADPLPRNVARVLPFDWGRWPDASPPANDPRPPVAGAPGDGPRAPAPPTLPRRWAVTGATPCPRLGSACPVAGDAIARLAAAMALGAGTLPGFAIAGRIETRCGGMTCLLHWRADGAAVQAQGYPAGAAPDACGPRAASGPMRDGAAPLPPATVLAERLPDRLA